MKTNVDISDAVSKLGQLQNEIDKGDLQTMIEKAAQPLINAARSNARRVSSSVANSIGYIEKNDSKFRRSKLIGPAYPQGALAHIFEFGTQPRFKLSNGARTGQISPKPFMRPALDSTRETVFSNLEKGIIEITEQHAKKLNLT